MPDGKSGREDISMLTTSEAKNPESGRYGRTQCGSPVLVRPGRAVRTGIVLLAVLGLLVSCTTPSWHIEEFGSLDLAGFGVMESELSFFADRQADPVFFDGFLASAGPSAGLPEAFSSPLVKDRIRQVLVLRPAGKPFILGLISIDAPSDLLAGALESGGFKVLGPGAVRTGADSPAPGLPWYSRDGNLLLSLPAPGLIVFQIQTFPLTGKSGPSAPAPAPGTASADDPANTGPNPAIDSTQAGADAASPGLQEPASLTALENFAALITRLETWKNRPGSVLLPDASHKPPQRLLKVDLDLRSSGAVGRILGALVLRSLSLDFRSSTEQGRVELAFTLKTPPGTGTGVAKKAVRLMLLGISNRLGLDAGFLEAIRMEGKEDTLEITGLKMSRAQGIDFIALLMGSSGS